nr:hypothetical protein [Candidatus Njordarchaeota archaeon]
MKKQVPNRISIALLSLVVVLALVILFFAPFDPDTRGLLFEVTLLLAPVFFPKIKNVSLKLIVVSVMAFLLVLSAAAVDYSVVEVAFSGSLSDIWAKDMNLFWLWMWNALFPLVFLTFALFFKMETGRSWDSFKIYGAGLVISLISFEDILYYPMGWLHHPEDGFPVPTFQQWWDIQWSWLPQHTAYLGRPITTPELITVVAIGMLILFLLVTGLFGRGLGKLLPKSAPKLGAEKLPDVEESSSKKLLCRGSIFIVVFVGFIAFYSSLSLSTYNLDLLPMIFTLAIALFSLFTILDYLPTFRSQFSILLCIFILMVVAVLLFIEVDWWAVEDGFHWISDKGIEVWDFNKFRVALWGILLPLVFFLAAWILRIGNCERTVVRRFLLSAWLLSFSGLGTVLAAVAVGAPPQYWSWATFQWMIFGPFYSYPVLVVCCLLSVFTAILVVFRPRILIDLKEKIWRHG